MYVEGQFLNYLVVALHELGPLQHPEDPVPHLQGGPLPLQLLHFSHSAQPKPWDAGPGAHWFQIRPGSGYPGSEEGI